MKMLIVSDIHANWPALRAVLEAESDAGGVLCLGDLVNFGPQPAECVAWAEEILPPEGVIQGNHDYALGFDEDPHCSPAYARLAAATQEFTRRLLTPEMKEFLADLEPMRSFKSGKGKCVACHASPKDPLYGYLPETASVTLWEAEVVRAGLPDFLFLGHTHVPMKTRLMKTLIVNPSSVGLPQDGDARAAYAIWEDGDVTLRRAPYDVEETVRAYDGLGLPAHILRQITGALRTGKGPAVEHFDGTAKTPARTVSSKP